jgi:superfamily II DNA or RNA helicase
MEPKGTIYLRDNAWYKKEHVIKMGIASFAKDRSNTYITGEVERGEYVSVIEIPLDKMRTIDKFLKNYFKEYNIYKGGGTEFYDRSIIGFIEPYLNLLNIDYKVLTPEEILLMNRCERIRNIPNVDKVKTFFNKLKKKDIQKYKGRISNIEPNKHQQEVLDIIEPFYRSNDIGKIIWACGLGKALLSILIVKKMRFNSVIIGVPSINLQKQIKKEILKVFPDENNILFVGGDKTNKKEIIRFLASYGVKFIVTTYHSCECLLDINVDFKAGDEAHHLVGPEKDTGFRSFHKIPSTKTLFMTATEKTIDKQEKETYSMDDESKFGKVIDCKSVHWAIENKKITDYNILVLKNTDEEVDQIIRSLRLNIKNRELFISCYMCLKSFEKYTDLTHVLLYTNNTVDADLCKEYIDKLLLKLSFPKEIYNNSLHSKNCNDLEAEVQKFKNSPRGIIPCVYIFGEGFDLPKLNGVCIAGNMESQTRIAQYLLRPNRLERENPNKIAYVIIPCIDSDDWDTEKRSYEKLKNIISQMRNVDESIEQKIFVSVGKKRGTKKRPDSAYDFVFEDNGDELEKLKLRLRHSKTLGSKFTEEQDEYNYVRSINAGLNIQSKTEYVDSKLTHINFIDNPEEYFKSKGVWNNWYDFMGVDTKKFIQSKEEWINFCKEKGVRSLCGYYMLCDEYDILPKDPGDFYKEFTNIPSELGFNYRRR